MAERRMFAKTIVLSDAFLDMPLSARCLYFTLGMVADDDGFVNNPKSIMRQCGAQEDDIKLLLAKKFLLSFDTGVIVIKHWRMNNYLQKDRYRETKYLEEKSKLSIDKNGAYHDVNSMYTQSVYTQSMYTQDSIVKDSIVKYSIGKDRLEEDRLDKENDSAAKPPRARRFSTPSVDEVSDYCTERKNSVDPQRFVDYYTANGWKVGKNPMKDWKAAVRTWEKNGVEKHGAENRETNQNRSHSFSELIEMGVFDDDG